MGWRPLWFRQCQQLNTRRIAPKRRYSATRGGRPTPRPRVYKGSQRSRPWVGLRSGMFNYVHSQLRNTSRHHSYTTMRQSHAELFGYRRSAQQPTLAAVHPKGENACSTVQYGDTDDYSLHPKRNNRTPLSWRSTVCTLTLRCQWPLI